MCGIYYDEQKQNNNTLQRLCKTINKQKQQRKRKKSRNHKIVSYLFAVGNLWQEKGMKRKQYSADASECT